MWWINLSIKYKLLIIIIAVTSAMLFIYGFVAIREFKLDKTAYIFESSSRLGQSIAGQMQAEISFLSSHLKAYVKTYDFEKKIFTDSTQLEFIDDPYLSGLVIYDYNTDNDLYYLTSSLFKADDEIFLKELIQKNFLEISKELFNSNFSLRIISSTDDRWILALKYENVIDKTNKIVFGVVKESKFMNIIKRQNVQSLYLVNAKADLIISSKDEKLKLAETQFKSMAQKLIKKTSSDITVDEVNFGKSKSFLVTLVKIGVGSFYLISAFPKNEAYKTIEVLTHKTIWFLGLLVSITLGLVVLLTNYLTQKLKNLLEATKKVGSGNLDVSIINYSKDEVGELTSGFNLMVGQIKSLLKETEEKARMQAELETAQLVQSTLFPPTVYSSKEIQIVGHHISASECGGDWWHYKKINNKFYMMIGDATGHGAPAALVTSAVCSAVNILESFADMSLENVVDLLNSAIYEVSKGKVGMTFFIGCLDLDSGKLNYCNASHNAPLIIQGHLEKISKKNMVFLSDTSGPPLGDNSGKRHQSYTVEMNSNDFMFLFTDGISELENSNSEQWGERQLFNVIMKSANKKMSIEEIVQNINEEAQLFRGNHPLVDDVTYYVVKRN